jgi:CBS domain containing-hemolysin-like protein
VAFERPEAVAMWVVKPCEVFMRVFSPFIRVLHGFAKAVVKAAGLQGGSGHSMVHSEEELKMLVTASQEAGVLEEQEEQMLHRVFGFADLTAGQVMVPRTELVGIEAQASAEDLLALIVRTGYARLPVYRNDLDNVIGILHITDAMKAMAAGDRRLTPGALAREALTVPETLGADDLLAALRRRGVHEAIVIDEYGGTAGLVTFDSLMERIVGTFGGVHGRGERISVHADGSADIDGLALVTDVNEQFDLRIDEAVYTTVGGYVLGRIGRRTRVGDTIDVDGRKMRVVALDGLRVAKIWLSKPAQPAPQDDPAAG